MSGAAAARAAAAARRTIPPSCSRPWQGAGGGGDTAGAAGGGTRPGADAGSLARTTATTARMARRDSAGARPAGVPDRTAGGTSGCGMPRTCGGGDGADRTRLPVWSALRSVRLASGRRTYRARRPNGAAAVADDDGTRWRMRGPMTGAADHTDTRRHISAV